MAVAHLADLGHRRIAHLTGDLGVDAGRDRLRGYRAEVRARGLDDDPGLVVAGDFRPERSRQAAGELLRLSPLPTAVFAASDEMALILVQEFGRAGCVVPDDVSVIGFDGISGADWAHPALTTIGQPIAEMGRRVVELLLDHSANPGRPPVHVRLPTALAVRESTAPPRA